MTTYENTYPRINKYSTSSSPSPSSIQVRATLQRKKIPSNARNSCFAPCRLSLILTSCDEDDNHENKEKIPSQRKRKTKEMSISLKSIFNLPSKNNSL